MITFLSGGTGTPKLIQGFRRIINDNQINIIANSADDIWINGLYVSPDVDTILYLFSGLLDVSKYWGIKGDTYITSDFLNQIECKNWFSLGDKDLAIHLYRTQKIREGMKLSEITRCLCEKLDIDANILPCSDNHIETRIITEEGEDIHFQEFWVKLKGEVNIKDVYIKQIEIAEVPDKLLESLEQSDLVIIGPSNPITSIGPIIKIKEINNWMKRNKEKCIAISPIIGKKAISGPAAQLMKAKGYEVTALGVSEIYKDLISTFIIDQKDSAEIGKITQTTGIETLAENIVFKSEIDATELSKIILKH